MLEGAQVVVTPLGAETAVRPTVPVKPPLAVRLTMDVADPPDPNETLVGLAEIPKSGPPARKNSTGAGAFTSPCPTIPPPQTSSRGFIDEASLYAHVGLKPVFGAVP